MTESSPSSSGSLQPTCVAAAAAADKSCTVACSGTTASRLLQSRVGREMQRYDGATRLLACVVVLRRAAAGRKQESAAAPNSTISACNDDDAQHDDAAEEDRVLVISSSKHPDQWILPKGGWESDESLVECALREAEEEAGIAGEVVRELGALDFISKNGKHCRFHGFQLRARQEFQTWAESDRQRKWVAVADARLHLRHRPELLAMLERAFR